jgi:hypothetical protein
MTRSHRSWRGVRHGRRSVEGGWRAHRHGSTIAAVPRPSLTAITVTRVSPLVVRAVVVACLVCWTPLGLHRQAHAQAPAQAPAQGSSQPRRPADGQRRVALVITGGIVVTVDPNRRVLNPGAIAIDGTEIVAVDTPGAIARQFTATQTINVAGQIVMPGLINTHTHAPMVMYRGLADDLALMEWLQKYIFPAEAKTVTPAFVRTGTRLAALEMIQSGTTAYADMYYFEEEVAKATKEAGMRGVLGQTVI